MYIEFVIFLIIILIICFLFFFNIDERFTKQYKKKCGQTFNDDENYICEDGCNKIQLNYKVYKCLSENDLCDSEPYFKYSDRYTCPSKCNNEICNENNDCYCSISSIPKSNNYKFIDNTDI